MAKKPVYEELKQWVKELEKELKESKERFRLIIESTSDLISTTTFSLTPEYTYVSPSATILGYISEDLIGKSGLDFIHPEDKKRLLPLLMKYVSAKAKNLFTVTDKSVYEKITYRFRDKSGDWHDLQSTVNIIGKELLFISRDITENRQANAELNKEKERFRVLVEELPLGISLIRKDGHYEYINPKFTELFGYTLEDVPNGKEWFKKAYPDRKQRHKAVSVWFQLVKDTKHGEYFQRELNVTCKDGSEKTIFFRMMNMEAGQALVLYEDITKTKRLEEQFQHSQKMEAIGTLAGGIAHDFNNLLMGIQGRASLMMIDTDSAHPYFEPLKGIEEYVKSAADLTKQLLGFARAGKYEVKPIDLSDIIKKSSMMFARTKKEITIHGKYQKDIWIVEADQGQIEQVLLNLYVNSWQAMPNGGEIYLETENVVINEDYSKTYRIEPGRYVKISITDTGIGMDEATKKRIFEPFFTTNEMGRGTGLGLASVYGIIKNHGGFINVYSEKGKGSTFNIYLPAMESEVGGRRSEVGGQGSDVGGQMLEVQSSQSSKHVVNGLPAVQSINNHELSIINPKRSEIREGIKHGHETILLVDDENMIIDVGKQILEMMGYKVLTAKSGKEATEIYKQNMDKIDMVILDMIMPDIGGSEVYDRLKKINPEIKVLLSSGYSINGLATEILNRGCNGFIQKPFSIKKLSHKLREVLMAS